MYSRLRERLGRRGAGVVGIGLLALLILALTLALNLGGVRYLLVSSPVVRLSSPAAQRQKKIWSASQVDGLSSDLCRNSGAIDLASVDIVKDGITGLKLHAYRGSGICQNAVWLDVTNNDVGGLQVHLYLERGNVSDFYNSDGDHKNPDVPEKLTRWLAPHGDVWQVGPMLGYDPALQIPDSGVYIGIDISDTDGGTVFTGCRLLGSFMYCSS